MPLILRYLERELVLPQGQYVLGRGSDCELCFRDALVSRRHALIAVEQGGATIEDLGSRNGVRVNGAAIRQPRPLRAGDAIEVGREALTVMSLGERHAADAVMQPTPPAGVSPPEGVPSRPTPTARASAIPVLPRSARDAAQPSERTYPTQWRDDETARVELPRSEPPDPRPAAAGAAEQDDAASRLERADRWLNILDLVGAVADKALGKGDSDVAKQALSSALDGILDEARRGGWLSPIATEVAASNALRLAAARPSEPWVEYVLELYMALRRPVPERVGALLEETLPHIGRVDEQTFARYRQHLDWVGRRPSEPERRAWARFAHKPG